MLEHLWTHEPAPAEYLTLVLCRTYGALPSELAREDGLALFQHLTCMTAEAQVAKAK